MKNRAFTLVELLVVLAVLSMTAGVVLPSAAVMTRKNRLDDFVHHTSVLCREAFEKAVFAGQLYRIVRTSGDQLEVQFYENQRWIPSNDLWLRPLAIPDKMRLNWPENGWQVLPEGYCESPMLRFYDENSHETVFAEIRACDARLVRKSDSIR